MLLEENLNFNDMTFLTSCIKKKKKKWTFEFLPLKAKIPNETV